MLYPYYTILWGGLAGIYILLMMFLRPLLFSFADPDQKASMYMMTRMLFVSHLFPYFARSVQKIGKVLGYMGINSTDGLWF